MTDIDLNSYPSSVPHNTQINFRGFLDTSEDFIKFSKVLPKIIRTCGIFMDLELLSGVTVGIDYDEALYAVDLGYESSIAKNYSKNENYVGVAKTLKIKKDNQIKAHVVFNASAIINILDEDQEIFFTAMNIIAHEMGHVAELKWQMKAMPELILKPYPFESIVTSYAYDSAISIWSEYAACRLAATIRDKENNILKEYGKTFSESCISILERAKQLLNEYNPEENMEQLFLFTGKTIFEPLRMAGYLLGHLDGSNENEPEPELPININELSPNYSNSIYYETLPAIHQELRNLWNNRESWGGIEVFDKLHQHLLKQFEYVGIYPHKIAEDNYYFGIK